MGDDPLGALEAAVPLLTPRAGGEVPLQATPLRRGERAQEAELDQPGSAAADEVAMTYSVRRYDSIAELFAADLILFMPGMTGNAWFDATDLPRSPGGLLQADAQCRIPGTERIYVVGDSGSFPGPDWMPKQAHQADLQAEVAARNLLRGLRGEAADERFLAELVCIVDSLDRGMLVTRRGNGGMALPPLRVMHWAKAAFEKRYLRRYR